jgi:hypothetical protein
LFNEGVKGVIVKGLRVWCGVCLGLILLSASAFAQIQTGEIYGTVTDEVGEALPGVLVTVTSPALQGARTEVTDEGGFFRFPVLPMGAYKVVFELDNFTTVEVTDVQAIVGQKSRVEASMPSSTIEETLVVTSEAPLIDASTSDNKFEFDSRDLEMIPTLTRSIEDVAKYVPGVTGVRINTVTGEGEGLPNIRGQGQEGNQYVVDGLSARGSIGFDNVIEQNFDSIDSLQIVSDPYSPEYGKALGGAINVVTKSGSNQFSGEFGYQYLDDSLEADREPVQPVNSVTGFDRTKLWANLGAPIMRDRVWAFVSYNLDEPEDVSAGADPYVIDAENLANPDGSAYGSDLVFYNFQDGSDKRETESMFGKLTFNVASNQSLFASYLDSTYDRSRQIGQADLWRAYVTDAYRWRMNYNLIAGAGVLELKAGAQENDYTVGGLTDISVANRYIRDIAWNFANRSRYDNQIESRDDWGAKWTGYVDTDGFGDHEYSLGFTIDEYETDWTLGTTGLGENFMPSPFGPGAAFTFEFLKADDGRIIVGADGQPILIPDEFEENRDQLKPSKVDGHGIFLQDRVTFKNWTIMAGVRLDQTSLYDDLGQELWSWDESEFVSPRLSVLYDVGGTHKHIAKFSYGVFKDTATTRILEFFLREGGYAYRRHQWIGDTTGAASEAELHDPANWTFQTEQSPESNPIDYDPGIEPNTADRFSLEWDWRINPEHALTFRYTQSDTKDMLEDVATFEYSADQGEPGYDPDEAGVWTFLLVNHPLKERNFKSFDMVFRGEVGQLLDYTTSYTWTENMGTNPGEFETAVLSAGTGSGNYIGIYADNAQARPEDLDPFNRFVSALGVGLGSVTDDEGWYGPLSDATDHAINFVGSWHLPGNFEAVTALQWVSGYHYALKGFNDLYGEYVNFPEGRGSRETGDAYWLDLSFAYNWNIGSDYSLQLRLDAFNVTDSQEVLQYVQEDTIDFEEPYTRQDPRAFMFGVRFQY